MYQPHLYFLGPWDAEAYRDVRLCWMDSQKIDYLQKEVLNLAHADQTPNESEETKIDKASVMLMGGDKSLLLMFKSTDILIVASRDSQAGCVIDVINRKTHKSEWSGEAN